jgi:aspartyl-tRNA(Asn)/glutamyl-tRNA(Gln) amidotransferase subunit B
MSAPLIRGYEVVIGLETHVQLSTQSKIFSGASTQFGAAPNTQSCPVDLALPGTLPVMNKGAVERAIEFGLAVGAQVAPRSIFARKNYFYPDLPKGYQISQYESRSCKAARSASLWVTNLHGAPGARPFGRRCRQIAAR